MFKNIVLINIYCCATINQKSGEERIKHIVLNLLFFFIHNRLDGSCLTKFLYFILKIVFFI